MSIIGFDETVNVRIRREEIKKINKILRKNRDRFYNKSHFVRSSILKYMREFDDKGNKIK